MSRHTAREHLFQLTFEFLFSKEKNEDTLNAFLLDATLSDDDKKYLSESYDGIVNQYAELTDTLSRFTEGYVIDRLYKPDLAAMLISTYEMEYLSAEIPAAVSINEAVDLVKRYSAEKSKAYVNGVLASVYKFINEEE